MNEKAQTRKLKKYLKNQKTIMTEEDNIWIPEGKRQKTLFENNLKKNLDKAIRVWKEEKKSKNVGILSELNRTPFIKKKAFVRGKSQVFVKKSKNGRKLNKEKNSIEKSDVKKIDINYEGIFKQSYEAIDQKLRSFEKRSPDYVKTQISNLEQKEKILNFFKARKRVKEENKSVKKKFDLLGQFGDFHLRNFEKLYTLNDRIMKKKSQIKPQFNQKLESQRSLSSNSSDSKEIILEKKIQQKTFLKKKVENSRAKNEFEVNLTEDDTILSLQGKKIQKVEAIKKLNTLRKEFKQSFRKRSSCLQQNTPEIQPVKPKISTRNLPPETSSNEKNNPLKRVVSLPFLKIKKFSMEELEEKSHETKRTLKKKTVSSRPESIFQIYKSNSMDHKKKLKTEKSIKLSKIIDMQPKVIQIFDRNGNRRKISLMKKKQKIISRGSMGGGSRMKRKYSKGQLTKNIFFKNAVFYRKKYEKNRRKEKYDLAWLRSHGSIPKLVQDEEQFYGSWRNSEECEVKSFGDDLDEYIGE